jgi:hypothetical protein
MRLSLVVGVTALVVVIAEWPWRSAGRIAGSVLRGALAFGLLFQLWTEPGSAIVRAWRRSIETSHRVTREVRGSGELRIS